MGTHGCVSRSGATVVGWNGGSIERSVEVRVSRSRDERMMREVARVLKPGDRVALADFIFEVRPKPACGRLLQSASRSGSCLRGQHGSLAQRALIDTNAGEMFCPFPEESSSGPVDVAFSSRTEVPIGKLGPLRIENSEMVSWVSVEMANCAKGRLFHQKGSPHGFAPARCAISVPYVSVPSELKCFVSIPS
jgi:hypothetical protein